MFLMGGDQLYFHVFTFRESLLVKSTDVWSAKPSPLKRGAGYGVHLADLFPEKGRAIVRPGNLDAGGRLGGNPCLPPRPLSARPAGTGGKGAGKGGSGAGAPEVFGNHLPSSHLVAMMPKAKTTAAKTPIMAA